MFLDRAVHGFVALDILVDEGPDDLEGHGTHVAGTCAGAVHGVAKRANVISVKVLSTCPAAEHHRVSEFICSVGDRLIVRARILVCLQEVPSKVKTKRVIWQIDQTA